MLYVHYSVHTADALLVMTRACTPGTLGLFHSQMAKWKSEIDERLSQLYIFYMLQELRKREQG